MLDVFTNKNKNTKSITKKKPQKNGKYHRLDEGINEMKRKSTKISERNKTKGEKKARDEITRIKKNNQTNHEKKIEKNEKFSDEIK